MLCDKENIRPFLAIELDDSSHQREDRIERDELVNKILHDAGLPILHERVASFYDEDALQDKIYRSFNFQAEI